VPSPRRARAVALVALSSAIWAGACNAITGEHDRSLRKDVDGALVGTTNPISTGDAAQTPDAASPVDASPDVFEVVTGRGALWKTPNGASWTSDDAGTRITAFGATGHAVIFPNPQPALPTDDYTVEATVHSVSPVAGYPEFGVLARVLEPPLLDDDAGVLSLISSSFGIGEKTWVGTMGPPQWSPSLISQSQTAHPLAGDRRFHVVLHAHGNNITGRMWDVTGADPGLDEVFYVSPRTTGRGVGFYTYGVIDASLEDLRVTVP
jgi:hypothetical protein